MIDETDPTGEDTAPVAPGGTPERPPTPWTFFDFLLLLVCSVVGALVASLALAVTGSDLGDPSTMDAAVILLGQAIGGLGYLTYMSQRRGQSHWGEDFGLRLTPFRTGALFIGVGLQIVVGFASVLFIPEDSLEQGISDIVAETTGLWPKILIAVLSVILAPIVEELIFRGVLLRWLQSVMAAPWAVLVSALLFAAFHLLDANLYILPGLMVVGLVLGWVAARDGNLSRAIPIHMGFNLVGVVALFIGVG